MDSWTKQEARTSLRYSIVAFVLLLSEVIRVFGEYSDQWAVEIVGGLENAKSIAERHNLEILGVIFEDVYHVRHRRLARRSVQPASSEHHASLVMEPDVRWAEQQVVKRRVKRDLHTSVENRDLLNDPKWPDMWYLNRGSSLDMNVQKAWLHGVTGKGVVATILDDGLEKDHPDLIKNYDPNASYDVNSHDFDPSPRYDLMDSNRHGTRCAGEVAADANNTICAVGIAYEASIGGVRMLDGDVTDAVEARSLALNPQHIDIYSASWGPDDDGKTVDGPGKLATRAFSEGIANGRNGKGSIFVWASGNGGRDEDNCNCDGYTNAIWTLSISSATEKGRVPWYSEACSSTLATTYSSGSLEERQIITTDLHHRCTLAHTGTSASAPLAAGIVALALQANMNLTWRDMQHIVMQTSRPENLHAPDWLTNGVGRKVSHRFGYGLMDAYAMVKLAQTWVTVPVQRKCEVDAVHVDKLIPQKSYVTLELEVINCPGVMFLEHVQAKVSLSAERRGEIEIYLTSPAGTRSTLLAQRPRDRSRNGFRSWPFMTVHMWGESPLGTWKLEIHNNGHFNARSNPLAQDWSLLLYGTETQPGIKASQSEDISLEHPRSGAGIIDIPFSMNGLSKSKGSTGEREPSLKDLDTVAGVPSSSAPVLHVVGSQRALPKGCYVLDSAGDCLECNKGFFLSEFGCVEKCPDQWFGSSTEDTSDPAKCFPCHYSCRHCDGPMNYQCTECFGDAELYSIKGQNFCYSQSLLDQYNTQYFWYKLVLALLIILSASVLIIAFIFMCTKCTQDSVKASDYVRMRDRSRYCEVRMDETNIAKLPYCDDDYSDEGCTDKR